LGWLVKQALGRRNTALGVKHHKLELTLRFSAVRSFVRWQRKWCRSIRWMPNGKQATDAAG
jgi:hypothetical protein